MDEFEPHMAPEFHAAGIEAIKYHMEQKGLSPHDLIPFIGSRDRVYEVLARKRQLT
jgi:HTH-type transcriptional regulator/antitoxin HigA